MKLCRLEDVSKNIFQKKYFSRWKNVQHFTLKIIKKIDNFRKKQFSEKIDFSKISIFLRIFNEKCWTFFHLEKIYFFWKYFLDFFSSRHNFIGSWWILDRTKDSESWESPLEPKYHFSRGLSNSLARRGKKVPGVFFLWILPRGCAHL